MGIGLRMQQHESGLVVVLFKNMEIQKPNCIWFLQGRKIAPLLHHLAPFPSTNKNDNHCNSFQPRQYIPHILKSLLHLWKVHGVVPLKVIPHLDVRSKTAINPHLDLCQQSPCSCAENINAALKIKIRSA